MLRDTFPPKTRTGHAYLQVYDLERSLVFYYRAGLGLALSSVRTAENADYADHADAATCNQRNPIICTICGRFLCSTVSVITLFSIQMAHFPAKTG